MRGSSSITASAPPICAGCSEREEPLMNDQREYAYTILLDPDGYVVMVPQIED